MKEENKDAIESIDEYYPSVKTTLANGKIITDKVIK